MNGNMGNPGEEDRVSEDIPEDETPDEASEEYIDLAADDDIVGGSTAEIAVDKLVEKIASEDPDEAARHREVRQKIEALDEGHDDELGNTYNFNLDDEL